MFKVHFNSADLIGDLNYLTKAINFLNSDISKKINVNKEDEIKKQYINKVKDIFIKYKQIKQNS